MSLRSRPKDPLKVRQARQKRYKRQLSRPSNSFLKDFLLIKKDEKSIPCIYLKPLQ